MNRLAAMIAQRCPRCLQGKVFSGSFAMNETCPSCGLVFGREQGYFMGAMYMSYGLSIGWNLTFALLLHLVFPASGVTPVLFGAWLLFLPFVPWTFRESRVVWMHFDRFIDRLRGADEKGDGGPRRLPMA